MNNMIVCEGFDDAYIIGYYLYKTSQWVLQKNAEISSLFKFPPLNNKNQKIEVYKKNADTLTIWCVGGKDNFNPAFKFLRTVMNNAPKECFQKVFIFTDRDECPTNDRLTLIEDKISLLGIGNQKLENNKSNIFNYEIGQEKEKYQLNIVPVIIPFEQTGALETILMAAIEEEGEEEAFVVAKAKQYIDEILQSKQLVKYLNHERKILKAKFSSVISIINPDRSTALFNSLLTSCNWEESETIKKHFKGFDELL